MKKSFVPREMAELIAWFSNFAKKLSKYKDKYGLTDDEVTDMQKANLGFSYWSEVINLTQLQHKIQLNNDTLYVVNFWATWCKPCIMVLRVVR